MGKIDVTALGELLIDFTENGRSGQGNRILEENPGGAPCNVLAMLQNLGNSTAFIGKVGQDQFGIMLKRTIEECGICADGLVFDPEVHTTLTFVETLPGGDREFSFYRNPGADMKLTVKDVNPGLIEQCRIFHFGTLSMTHPECREATEYALETAEKYRRLRSFDPNLRLPLWESAKAAKRAVAFGLNHCDILKIADNEIEFMTGESDIDKGIEIIRDAYGIPLVCATMGSGGSKIYYKDQEHFQKAFIQKETVETTGAGDTFAASILHFVLEYGLDYLDGPRLKRMLRFANGAASVITTRKGALKVMPKRSEVEDLISKSR